MTHRRHEFILFLMVPYGFCFMISTPKMEPIANTEEESINTTQRPPRITGGPTVTPPMEPTANTEEESINTTHSPPRIIGGPTVTPPMELTANTEEESINTTQRPPRIIGGTTVNRADFPYLIQLMRDGGSWTTTDEDLTYVCGASYISPTFALTAAHCLHGGGITPPPAETFKIAVQDETVAVVEYHQHACYRSQSRHNDIALLKLKSPLSLSDTLKIVSLPTFEDQDMEQRRPSLTVVGFEPSWDFDPGSDTKELVVVNLTYLPIRKCREKVAEQKGDARLVVARMHICTESGIREEACYVEGGSPVMSNGVQVGVVSWVYQECHDGRPNVFTRTDTYMPWILNVTEMHLQHMNKSKNFSDIEEKSEANSKSRFATYLTFTLYPLLVLELSC